MKKSGFDVESAVGQAIGGGRSDSQIADRARDNLAQFAEPLSPEEEADVRLDIEDEIRRRVGGFGEAPASDDALDSAAGPERGGHRDPGDSGSSRSAALLLESGAMFLRQGNLEMAAKAFQDALKLEPSLTSAWFNLGLTLMEMQDPTEAVQCFDRVLVADPRDARALTYKGSCLGLLGNDAAALAAFDRAIRLDGDDAAAWFGKGFSLGRMGRFPEALPCFQSAERLGYPQAAEFRQNVEQEIRRRGSR